MSIVRPNARSFANTSFLLSVVSGVGSLFFYLGAHKPFVILTTVPVLSVIAGIIAIAVIAYESLKMRTVATRSWAALALAFIAYWFSDFILIDYASGYSILQ